MGLVSVTRSRNSLNQILKNVGLVDQLITSSGELTIFHRCAIDLNLCALTEKYLNLFLNNSLSLNFIEILCGAIISSTTLCDGYIDIGPCIDSEVCPNIFLATLNFTHQMVEYSQCHGYVMIRFVVIYRG